MARRPTTRCTKCHQLATNQGRCDNHQRKPWENKSANSQALTGWERQAIRDQQLEREPTCRVCGTTENLEPDHIIEIADGGHLTDPSNLQTLCHPHHAAKTRAAREARKTRKARARA